MEHLCGRPHTAPSTRGDAGQRDHQTHDERTTHDHPIRNPMVSSESPLSHGSHAWSQRLSTMPQGVDVGTRSMGTHSWHTVGTCTCASGTRRKLEARYRTLEPHHHTRQHWGSPFQRRHQQSSTSAHSHRRRTVRRLASRPCTRNGTQPVHDHLAPHTRHQV